MSRTHDKEPRCCVCGATEDDGAELVVSPWDVRCTACPKGRATYSESPGMIHDDTCACGVCGPVPDQVA